MFLFFSQSAARGKIEAKAAIYANKDNDNQADKWNKYSVA